jgi:hypothetical protein
VFCGIVGCLFVLFCLFVCCLLYEIFLVQVVGELRVLLGVQSERIAMLEEQLKRERATKKQTKAEEQNNVDSDKNRELADKQDVKLSFFLFVCLFVCFVCLFVFDVFAGRAWRSSRAAHARASNQRQNERSRAPGRGEKQREQTKQSKRE